MKTIRLALLCSLVCLCLAGDTGVDDDPDKITTKYFEKDRNNDGIIDIKTETYFRGGQKVLTVIQFLKPAGNWSFWRIYYVNGKQILFETENAEGGLLTFTNPATDKKEIFKRSKDGQPVPLSAAELKAARSDESAMGKAWEKATNQDTDEAIKTLQDWKKFK